MYDTTSILSEKSHRSSPIKFEISKTIYHSTSLPLQGWNGATWLICFNRPPSVSLSGCLGTPHFKGTILRGRQFCGVVVTWIGDAAHTVWSSASPPLGLPWTLTTVATNLESIITCSKLKVSQVTAIRLNYIVVCAAISSAQTNLGADSKAPVRRPFKRGY